MPNLLTLSITAGVIALFSLPTAAAPGIAVATTPRLTEPESRLSAMLAKLDAMQPGAARDKYALEIDRFASQRYATVSRLYWYQSLDDAKAAAKTKKLPILHLRMLGRLDEDLSCANSRFFRSTLYANAETSKFLRDNFILYWSSERPVPRVTIDFGDGRKIERTTTGNSAHYVMDERGNVLDVLPGLYAPVVFRTELAKSAALANAVRELDDKKLLDEVIAFHKRELETTQKQFKSVAGLDFIVRRDRLLSTGEMGKSAVARAQETTVTKMIVETPDLAKIGIDAGAIDPTDIAQWATVGQKIWDIALEKRPVASPSILFDKQSVLLIEKLRAGNPRVKDADMPRVLARLEKAILADTALNELRLRAMIRSQLAYGGMTNFEALNDWIYAGVFHTPKQDAWLGLLDSTDFTALPADGVVKP